MKKCIAILSLLISLSVFGQGNSEEATQFQVLSVNPSKNSVQTTGLNVGILDEYQDQKINGLNIQANPFSLVYLLLPKSVDTPTKGAETVSINGIHLSTGGMIRGGTLNGIGISMYHIAQETNGITVNGFNNNSDHLNGIHVSLLNNSTEAGNGILVALSNNAKKFKGIQVGLYNDIGTGSGLQVGFNNKTEKLKGVQVGIINTSKSKKGLQIGFWNKNAKRTLPLINF